MTVLDVCVTVLQDAKRSLTAEEVLAEILRRGLYDFKAKDPLSIVRDALRRHLRKSTAPRIAVAEPGKYTASR